MANIIKYNSRLTLKYDTLSNWCPKGTWIDFTPLKGEVCIINPAEDLGAGASCLIKVGDGTTKIGLLPYLGAVAADVYDWAKASKVEYDGTTGKIKFYKGDSEIANSAIDLTPITTAITELGNRIGAINITTNSNTAEATSAIVAITKNDNADTYTATSKPLPTVTSISANGTITSDTKGYAVIADVTQTTGKIAPVKKYIPKATKDTLGVVKLDVNDSNNVAISKTTYDLRVSAVDQSIDNIEDEIDTYQDDKGNWKDAPNGAVIKTTYATNERVTGVANDLADLEDRIDNVANVMHFVGAVTSDPTAASFDVSTYHNGDVIVWTGEGREYVFVWPGEGTDNPGTGKFEEVGDTSRIADLEAAVAEHKSFSTIKVGSTEVKADETLDTLEFVEGNAIVLTGDATNDKITISHKTITCDAKKDTQITLAHEDTFDIIESVTVNSQGHVTAYQPRTIKLPAQFDPSSLQTSINEIKVYKTVTGDSGTTTADSVSDSLAIQGDGKITTTVSTDTVEIKHAAPGTKVERTDGTDDAVTPAHGGDFTVLNSIDTDSTGHIVAVRTKQVTLPSVEDITSSITAIKSYASVAGDSGTAVASAQNEKITFAGGTKIVTKATNSNTKGSDKLAIDHETTERVDTTSTAAPNHSETFTVVDSVTSDTTGHITAINVKTVTLPAQYDDSGLDTRLSALESTAWKTTIDSNETVAEGSTTTQISALSAQDLKIGNGNTSDIAYIVWDCGSATVNI